MDKEDLKDKVIELMAQELTTIYDEDSKHIKEIFFKKAKGEK